MEEQKEKKVVYCYGRISTNKNSQLSSIDTQEKYFSDYVGYHDDWILGKVFLERASGTKLNNKRPEFTKLLEACGTRVVQVKGKFMVEDIPGVKPTCDLIVVKSSSRFARSDYAGSLVANLAEKGIGLVIIDMGGACSLNSAELPNILFCLTNDSTYSKSLSANARWSYQQSICKRKMIYGSDNLFGYKRIKDEKDNKKVYLIPESTEHVEIINKMFNMYLEGYGFRRIQQYVEAQGFKSKKENKNGEIVPISVSGIKKMLENERYMGYLQLPIRDIKNNQIGKIQRKNRNGFCNYELIKADNITPIVSEELFKAVQEKRINKPVTKRSRGIKQSISKYGKLLYCECGCNFQKSYDSKKRPVYLCANRKENGISECNTPMIDESYVDEQIDLLKDNFGELQKHRKEEILQECNSFKFILLYNYFNTDNSKKIIILKEELNNFKSKMQELQENIMLFDIKTFANQTNFLQKEIDTRETELTELNNSFLTLKNELAKIEDTVQEVNNLNIPEKYSTEEIISQLAQIDVYKKDMDYYMSVEDLKKSKETKFKRNEVDMDFITILQSKMMYYLEELRHSLPLTDLTLTAKEQQELEQKYLDLLS